MYWFEILKLTLEHSRLLFASFFSQMRSDLDAIPAETCDKIHAEEWMDRQMLVFEEKQGTPTNSLMMKQMNLALKRW